MVMTVLLIWSLADIQSPRIITSDKHVIDLLATDPTIWVSHISEEKKCEWWLKFNDGKLQLQPERTQ
jgi:hypothetical protein